MSKAITIVSGGQTGVDRAALDVAMELGIACGGWVPAGRIAEDGVLPISYPLKELQNADYEKRTLQNVLDSDGTVIIFFEILSGGTEQTLLFCLNENRPYLLLDGSAVSPACAAGRITHFVTSHSIETLNVAGPRASEVALAYPYAFDALRLFITKYHMI